LAPTGETLRQALASGSNELVRDVWILLTPLARAEGLVSFGKVAADFHNGEAFAWLLGFAGGEQLEEIAKFVGERHRAGPLMTLVKAGFDVARSPGLAWHLAGTGLQHSESGEWSADTDYSWMEVLKVAPPARLPAWLSAFPRADARTRRALLDWAPASKDFVRFVARLVSAEGKAARAEAIAETVDHVIAHGGGAWKALLERFEVRWFNSPTEARALLASGVALEGMELGDALAVATWVYPERGSGAAGGRGRRQKERCVTFDCGGSLRHLDEASPRDRRAGGSSARRPRESRDQWTEHGVVPRCPSRRR
jgi:hypothetical protein